MLPNPDPLARIFNTLLLHALCDGARAIRLEAAATETDREIRMTGEERTIHLGSRTKEATIHFLIGESWRKQMTIPAFVFEPQEVS